MSFMKGALDGQVDQVIDKAATVVKEKVGDLMGGKAEPENKGVGDMVTDAVGKVAAGAAADNAADKVMSFGQNLFK